MFLFMEFLYNVTQTKPIICLIDRIKRKKITNETRSSLSCTVYYHFKYMTNNKLSYEIQTIFSSLFTETHTHVLYLSHRNPVKDHISNVSKDWIEFSVCSLHLFPFLSLFYLANWHKYWTHNELEMEYHKEIQMRERLYNIKIHKKPFEI